MTIDFDVTDFSPATHPSGLNLKGRFVSLEPLDASRHASDLYESNGSNQSDENWTYLPYGPFNTKEDFVDWISSVANDSDPVFFAVIRLTDQRAVGVTSFLCIDQANGSIEVGHINYSPLLQRTREGTEAMYLMMKWAFDNGYRRYQWRCNSLNIKSRTAAQRLGLSYEGVFRQMSIAKGRNRHTAWFAAIDSEWDALVQCFESYLSDDNLDAAGKPKHSLSELTRPHLYKQDSLEFAHN